LTGVLALRVAWTADVAVRSLTKLLDTPLKWIGAGCAVISLLLGANQLTRTMSEAGERRRQVAELRAVAAEQAANADYQAALASLDEAITVADQGTYLAKMAGRLDAVRLDLRAAQEDVAMAWLRDASVPSGSTFSTIVDPLVPIVTRGAVGADASRRADLLAHLGWAYFLKSRDGSDSERPERLYQQALDADPANPFAHANWGHWIMWQRGPAAEASQHFSAALASGRERPYVRRLQLAAFRLYSSPPAEQALIETVNDMRKNDEPVDAATRRAVFGIYFAAFNVDEYLERVLASLPPSEHIDTIRALYFDPDFDETRVPLRDAVVALLQERAGARNEALATWRTVQAAVSSGGDQRVARHAAAALERLSPGPQ
jgi:hypothetical protein